MNMNKAVKYSWNGYQDDRLEEGNLMTDYSESM